MQVKDIEVFEDKLEKVCTKKSSSWLTWDKITGELESNVHCFILNNYLLGLNI